MMATNDELYASQIRQDVKLDRLIEGLARVEEALPPLKPVPERVAKLEARQATITKLVYAAVTTTIGGVITMILAFVSK